MALLSAHKLFIYDHLNSREFSEILIKDKGETTFFVILDLPKNRPEFESLLGQIIEKLATNFENIHEDDPEARLEEMLQRLNKDLRDLLDNYKVKNWISTIDMAVGICDKNNVYLSSIGNINGLLIRFNQLTAILEKNTPVNPAKIFTNITSGALESGDVLVVSTNALFDYISKEKVKQITKQYSSASAVIKMQELLTTVPDFVTFNALFIKNPHSLDREVKPEEIKKSDDLQDSITIKHPPHTKRKLVIDFSAFQKIKFFKVAADIFRSAHLFFKFIGRFLKKTYLFLTSKKYREFRDEQSLLALHDKVNKKYNWFSSLSRNKKIGLIVLFVTLLAFLQGLVFLTQQKAAENQSSGYKAALQAINDKFSEVEAKLLYNDEVSAENILLEISDTLASLRPTSPDEQSEINRIKEKVFHDLNKVRHIHDVISPTEIADLSTTLIDPRQIVQKNGKFYILDNTKLYVLENTILTPISDFSDGQFLSDWPDKNKLVLGKNDQYFIFDLDAKTLDSFDFTKTAGNTSIRDMEIYSNNLYVLDTQDNQIFKYPESSSSFSGGQAWLRQETDIKNAESFALDGSIYTLHADGKIKNWLKGEANTFDYHEPHPIIGAGATIKTFRDSDYLYIIDPKNQRVIILNKDGNIKDQYSSQKFDNLKDLSIDPEEKAIYLLNGNHLYLLAIN